MTAPTDPPQTDAEPTEPAASPRPRHRPPNWLLGAGGVAAAIMAIGVLQGSGEDTGPPDLSTPERAAQAFAQATAAGDLERVLATTCLGVPGCAAEHGSGFTTDHINAAKKVIADNLHKIGHQFNHAQFTSTSDGTEPGTRLVHYHIPGAPTDEQNYLIFVEYQHQWLYIATGSGPATN